MQATLDPRVAPTGRRFNATLTLVACLMLVGAPACGGSNDAAAAGGEGRGKGRGKGRGGGEQRRGGQDEGEEALAITVRRPRPGTIERRYEASGTLRARQSAEIRPLQSAIITDLLVEEGDQVSRGDRLARLDGRELALMAARDRIAAGNAAQELQRLERIGNADAIASSEIDLKRYELEAARAAAKLSRHQVRLAAVEAPFDGTITARRVDVGNLATANTVLFEIADLSSLELDLHLPELEAAGVEDGAKVDLALVDGTVFVGTVLRRAPVVDPLTGTVKFTVKVAERPARAVPGAFTRARVLLESRVNVPTVARGAVFQIDGEDHVFVVSEGKARRRKVEVGLQDDEAAEIVSGLEAHELVVVDPGDGLTDGMAVEPVEETPAGAARAAVETTREEG